MDHSNSSPSPDNRFAAIFGHAHPSPRSRCRSIAAGIIFSALSLQERVRSDLKQWLSWLRQEVGFQGLRLDFSKGYSGQWVKVSGASC